MHIALLAFGFPLTTCHILYPRIIFKIEYFYFLNRIDEWSFEKILGLHHVHNILGFHYIPLCSEFEWGSTSVEFMLML